MNIAAYIISWLSEDVAVREIRLKTVNLQIDEWLANTALPIFVIAMNYTNDELNTIVRPRVTIIPTESLSCTKARKRCQELFYNSQYKWAVIMDDDAFLYQHNSSYNLFAEMDSHIEDYRHIGAFFPHLPNITGFNGLYKDEPRYATHHIFSKLVMSKGTMCILRNLKLYGEEPIYNDTDFDMMEDVCFGIKLRLAGHQLYTCSNIVLKEYSHGASAFSNDNTVRIAKAKVASKLIVEKYPYLRETPKGITIDQSQLVRKCVNKPKKQIIPKSGVYDNSLFDWDSIR